LLSTALGSAFGVAGSEAPGLVDRLEVSGWTAAALEESTVDSAAVLTGTASCALHGPALLSKTPASIAESVKALSNIKRAPYCVPPEGIGRLTEYACCSPFLRNVIVRIDSLIVSEACVIARARTHYIRLDSIGTQGVRRSPPRKNRSVISSELWAVR
jgi:hypothetical protein